jgi:uncharacterized membrane protein
VFPFAFTAVLFFLQFIPFTGIFLMVVGAPFWSVFTLNVGLVLIGVAAIRRDVPRWALLFPVLWFGGNAVVAAVGRIAIARMVSQVEMTNGNARIAFDKASDMLVFPAWKPSELGLWPIQGTRFLVDYRVDTVIAPQEGAQCSPLQEFTYHDDACDQIDLGPVPADTLSGCRSGKYRPMTQTYPQKPMAACVAYRRIESAANTVIVEQVAEYKKGFGYEAAFETLTIRREGEASVSLNAIQGKTAPWLPMPMSGCFLNSSKASWECLATLSYWRETSWKPHGDSMYTLLARTLGVERRDLPVVP